MPFADVISQLAPIFRTRTESISAAIQRYNKLYNGRHYDPSPALRAAYQFLTNNSQADLDCFLETHHQHLFGNDDL